MTRRLLWKNLVLEIVPLVGLLAVPLPAAGGLYPHSRDKALTTVRVQESVFVSSGASSDQAAPGDVLLYTVTILNTGDQDASNVIFTNTVDPAAELLAGSVLSPPGSVVVTGNAPGDTSVAVNVGTLLSNGGLAVVNFKVMVRSPLHFGVTHISSQGLVTGTNLASTPTDDPGTPAPADPTIIPVAQAAVSAPALNEWGLLILILMLAGLGLWRLQRRAA